MVGLCDLKIYHILHVIKNLHLSQISTRQSPPKGYKMKISLIFGVVHMTFGLMMRYNFFFQFPYLNFLFKSLEQNE